MAKFAEAVSGYQSAMASNKQWLKDYATIRMQTAAPRSGRFDIALNAWLSHSRKRRESLQDDLDEVAAEACPDSAAPLADRVDLERAIACLSDGERAAIAACYYADLSHEEAAAALGMPLGTVKTHILRAKAKLRAHLGKEEP